MPSEKSNADFQKYPIDKSGARAKCAKSTYSQSMAGYLSISQFIAPIVLRFAMQNLESI